MSPVPIDTCTKDDGSACQTWSPRSVGLADVQLAIRQTVVAGQDLGIISILTGGKNAGERLQIHRRHYESSLITAILARFPATVWLTESEFVTEAARRYIREHPPRRPCLAGIRGNFSRVSFGLLDLSGLDRQFQAEFGRAEVRAEWFSEVLKLALAITAAGGYESFSDITEAALKVIEERYQQELSPTQRKKLLQGIRELPAFPDVRSGLQGLSSEGYQLVVLTNSREKAAKEAIQSASLSQLFHDVLSADYVKRLKPAPEPYRMLAKKSGVKPSDVLLVAAHSWDVAGALRAGCGAAFVRRPQQVLDELTPKPDFIVADLVELTKDLRH